jgi:two-component system nitrogen regulation response regulator GlnG
MAPGQTVEVKDLPQDLIDERPIDDIASTPTSPAAAKTEGDSAAERSDDAAGGDRHRWIALLETEAAQMLTHGLPEVMDVLGRQFEATLIKAALKHTHGRKNDAAVRLGIGRNTITRKIQELNIGGVADD